MKGWSVEFKGLVVLVVLLFVLSFGVAHYLKTGSSLISFFNKDPYCDASGLKLTQASQYVRDALDSQELLRAQREYTRSADCFAPEQFDLDGAYSQGKTYRMVLYCDTDLKDFNQQVAFYVEQNDFC